MLERFFDFRYVDLFSDYEEYHNNLETYHKIRALEISKWIDEGSTILDVGCGDGKNAILIKEKKNVEITGIDIVDKANKIIPVIKSDLNREGLKGNRKYDYVILCEVIEHLLYPNIILKQSTKIANKGVIVAIPNTGYFYWRLQMCFGYFPRQSFTHIHFWTLKDFRIFCQQLGINIEKFKVNPSATATKKILKALFPNLFAYQLYFYLSPARLI